MFGFEEQLYTKTILISEVDFSAWSVMRFLKNHYTPNLSWIISLKQMEWDAFLSQLFSFKSMLVQISIWAPNRVTQLDAPSPDFSHHLFFKCIFSYFRACLGSPYFLKSQICMLLMILGFTCCFAYKTYDFTDSWILERQLTKELLASRLWWFTKNQREQAFFVLSDFFGDFFIKKSSIWGIQKSNYR